VSESKCLLPACNLRVGSGAVGSLADWLGGGQVALVQVKAHDGFKSKISVVSPQSLQEVPTINRRNVGNSRTCFCQKCISDIYFVFLRLAN
jgi:hypothetical protein